MTKFGLKHYFEPTPKNMRVLGDSILYGVGLLSSAYVAAEINWTIGVVIVLAIVGKFLTNMATTEK